MTNVEHMITSAIAAHDAEKEMIRKASELMYELCRVNAAGETSAEDVLLVNEWCERENRRAQEKLTRKIIEASKLESKVI